MDTDFKFDKKLNVYFCLYCKTNFKTSNNAKCHLITKTHESNKSKLFTCSTCKYVVASKIVFDKHFLTKTHKLKEDTYNNGNNGNNSNNIHNSQNNKLIKINNKDENNNEDNINTLKEEIQEIKEMIKTTQVPQKALKQLIKDSIDESKLAKSSSVLLNMLTRNYKDNPKLECYASEAITKELYTYFVKQPSKDQYILEKTLINIYKRKTLGLELKNLLVLKLKKDDPSEQSIFVSDISRATYLINLNKWFHDKKGFMFNIRIIDPLLTTVKELLGNYSIYIQQVLADPQDYEDVDLDKITEDSTYILKIFASIRNNSLCKSIINLLSPHFQVSDKMALPQ